MRGQHCIERSQSMHGKIKKGLSKFFPDTLMQFLFQDTLYNKLPIHN